MNEIEKIKKHQKAWADSNGIELDQDNYVDVYELNKNFVVPLSAETIRDLTGGDGSEYPKDEKTRTKILATHSSSALVCNFFEYWRFKY